MSKAKQETGKGNATETPAPSPIPASGNTPEGLFALAIAGANDGLWDWDARTGRVYRSARVQEILGLPPTESIATADAWLALMHPIDAVRYKAEVSALFRSASSHFECAYRMRHATGGYRWLLDRALVIRDETGRVHRMAGSVSDITDRKRAEDALRESEQRFRDYAEVSSDWFWETDTEHRFTESWARSPSQGFRAGSRLGKRRWEIADDAASESEKWRVHKARLDRREPFRDFVYKVTLADGAPMFVSISGKPVFDADGRFLGYRGSGRDVTNAMIQAETLRRTMLEAEAANAAKSQFLANMSHELRTPLNAILGFSEVIASEMMGPLANARYREYAEDILRSGRHLLELISDVLDMSKIEAGKLVLNEAPLSLRAVTEECLPLLRKRADDAAIRIAIEMPDDLPQVVADETRLKQILLNLLTNGIKFTPRGGRVVVAGRLEAGHAVVLSVSDTGIGMSEGDAILALQPFQQIENSTSKRYEGTGLGLPLVKRLVELHGGSIKIESALGRGTAVTVRFPPFRTMEPQGTPPLQP